MKGPSLAVDGLNLAFSAFVGSAHDFDGVTLANRDRAHVVLGPQILTQVTTHDLSSDA